MGVRLEEMYYTIPYLSYFSISKDNIETSQSEWIARARRAGVGQFVIILDRTLVGAVIQGP